MPIRAPLSQLSALGGLRIGNAVHRACCIIANQQAAVQQLLNVHRAACMGKGPGESLVWPVQGVAAQPASWMHPAEHSSSSWTQACLS